MAAIASGLKSRGCDYIRSAMATISPLQKLARRRCPICGKPALPQYRPFCSARCALIDLGRWLEGDYRIPSEEAPEEGDAEEGD
jgi:endogenous inhibitor of DNA gyrase (YacG/DUF329 family)